MKVIPICPGSAMANCYLIEHEGHALILDPALAGGVIVGRQTHPGLAVGQGQAVNAVGVDVVLKGNACVGQGRGV